MRRIARLQKQGVKYDPIRKTSGQNQTLRAFVGALYVIVGNMDSMRVCALSKMKVFELLFTPLVREIVSRDFECISILGGWLDGDRISASAASKIVGDALEIAFVVVDSF